MENNVWVGTEYSGFTPQNKYIISCDPCGKGGDHTVIWIKSPDDSIIELMDSIKPSKEYIYTVFGVPKKYWGRDKNKPK